MAYRLPRLLVASLAAYSKSAVWDSDPKLALFATARTIRSGPAYKGPIIHAAGAVAAEYVMVQMCASVASGQATPEQAARDAERRARRHYR